MYRCWEWIGGCCVSASFLIEKGVLYEGAPSGGGSWLLAIAMMESSLFAFWSSLLSLILWGERETRVGGEGREGGREYQQSTNTML